MIHPAVIGAIAGARRRSVGGPDVWYDVEEVADTDADGYLSYANVQWNQVTIGVAGTATKARLYIGYRFGACDLRMGLYTTGGSRLAQGLASSVGSAQWLEVTFDSPVAVTATDYLIASQGENSNLTYRYLDGAGALDINASNTFADGLPATLSSIGTFGRNVACSVYVD